jgi:hypothetical protein
MSKRLWNRLLIYCVHQLEHPMKSKDLDHIYRLKNWLTVLTQYKFVCKHRAIAHIEEESNRGYPPRARVESHPPPRLASGSVHLSIGLPGLAREDAILPMPRALFTARFHTGWLAGRPAPSRHFKMFTIPSNPFKCGSA